MSTPSAPVARLAGRGIPLGRPLGIPVYLSPSWWLLGALITFSQAGWISREFPNLGGTAYLLGALTAVLLAASVLAHELGHSAISLLLGIPIRRITLFLLGGVAEISREPETPAREYLIAIAGPLVSLFCAGVSAAAALAMPENSLAQFMAVDLAVINLTLGVLNLLPGLPLDGGRVLRAVVWRAAGDAARSTRVALRAGLVLALLIGTLGLARILSGDQGGALALLVAWFIWSSGNAALRRNQLVDRLGQLGVRQLTQPALCVAADLPLAEAVRRADVAGSRLVVVDSYGRPDAVISADAVQATPAARWPWIPVGAVARRLVPGLILDADLPGSALLQAISETPASEYLVVDQRSGALGVLTTSDVVRRLNAQAAS